MNKLFIFLVILIIIMLFMRVNENFTCPLDDRACNLGNRPSPGPGPGSSVFICSDYTNQNDCPTDSCYWHPDITDNNCIDCDELRDRVCASGSQGGNVPNDKPIAVSCVC